MHNGIMRAIDFGCLGRRCSNAAMGVYSGGMRVAVEVMTSTLIGYSIDDIGPATITEADEDERIAVVLA
jgi:hypothetical protein